MKNDLRIELESALAAFTATARDVLGDRLVSVILYGSVVFGDLAPGYGDLDFLAVVEGDLVQNDCARLTDARMRFRREGANVIERMLEGAFLPRNMLNPEHKGRALWWGTTGERQWAQNQLGAFAIHLVREHGRVIYGEDIRGEIPVMTEGALVNDIRRFCRDAREHGKGGTLHSIDWLFTAARCLRWLRDRRLSSKSEAADWAVTHAPGAWREALPQAKRLRLHPEDAGAPANRQWLSTLAPIIAEASAKVEAELRARRL
jgi:hypothetical protein